MRRFCWGSTVWKQPYANGYLGATLEDGSACPLLAQIADELRETFPAIFGAHGLVRIWGFKYDSTLGGINLHADRAAVNVNFWITPDAANRNPENGGLVIWDKSAPLEWEFKRYNAYPEQAREFLLQAGAKPVKVPYRANRAVIFDSDLFHETDTIEFKPGYRNRRINITALTDVAAMAAPDRADDAREAGTRLARAEGRADILSHRRFWRLSGQAPLRYKRASRQQTGVGD